jgi:hypothetical protein
MPGVDIVIPCYNYAHLLPQCVESVLSQDVSAVRVIIIDNASTDDSVAVARRLAARDPRIELVCHEENVGSHGSFNEGIDLASADYFMILCADDLLVSGALPLAIGSLEANPDAVCAIGAYDAPVVGDSVPVRHPGEGHAEAIASRSFIENCCRTAGIFVAAHALLVRTRSQKIAGHYRESIPQLDDLEMALRLASQGPVAQLSIPLAVRRLHSANVSVAMWNDRLLDLSERLAVFDSFFSREGARTQGYDILHGIARRRLGAWAYWSGLSHFARGEYDPGLQLLRFALRHSPYCVVLPPVGHLLRTAGAWRRILAVLTEAMNRPANRLASRN